jgi:L-threonylcarbamoyladenylate synthase
MTERTQEAARAAAVLAAGGLVLLPTDTLPGLHARADAPAAAARIDVLKGRDAGKPLLLLCADTDAALALTAADAAARAYAARCWPGPFTLILPAGPAAPQAALRGGTTVGLRVPSPAGLRALIAAAGGALLSTSANASGEPAPRSLDEVPAALLAAVDLVADLDWGGVHGAASALVDLSDGPPRLLRPGPLLPPES